MKFDHDANLHLSAQANKPKLVWTNPIPKRMLPKRHRVVRPIFVLFVGAAAVATTACASIIHCM